MPIYQELTQNNIFTQNSEFFIFCVFVGERYQKQGKLEQKYALSQAITLSDYDRVALESLYLQEHNSLATIKDTIELAEQYANGGIEYILDHVLHDLTYIDDGGNWRFNQGVENEIQIKLFDFTLDEKEAIPF